MAKALPAALALALALILQLAVINGLRLPGSGVPDVVLIVVAALAMASGAVPGMIMGFAAGLCLDLAPPGSPLIGQYALVFCLAGWAAGRLTAVAARSVLRAVIVLAAVVAAAEVFAAGLSHVLEPTQATLGQIRQVLPFSIGYDLLICPIAACLVMLASSWFAADPAAELRSGSVLVIAEARNRQRTSRKNRPYELRLREAAARPGDGWLGSGPHSGFPARTTRRSQPRLHAAGGVPGSASGLLHPPRQRPPSRNIKLNARKSGSGLVGGTARTAAGGGYLPRSHPGQMAGKSPNFRRHRGAPGGSATAQYRPARNRPASGQVPIRFTSKGSGSTAGRRLGGSAYPGPAGSAGLRAGGRAVPKVNFRASGRTPARRPPAVPKLDFRATGKAPARRPPAAPKLDFRAKGKAPARRPPAAARVDFRAKGKAPARRPPAAPKVDFRAKGKAPARRPPAEPRFRRKSVRAALSSSAHGAGKLDGQSFRAVRRGAVSAPRLRLARSRRRSERVGGSAPVFGRGPGRLTRQPRFGYGRRSVLSFLIGRRIGSQWLAKRRAGRRSGASLIGRRTGGMR